MDPRKQANHGSGTDPRPGAMEPDASPSRSDAVPDAHQACGRRAGTQPHSVRVSSCGASPCIPCDNPVERDTRNNKHLVVYPGSETADATQGAVSVLDFNGCNGEDRPTGEFPMTTKMGPLTLTGVEGDIVSFAYQSGRGTFNLDSYQFAMPKGRLLPSAGSLPVH